MKVILLEDVKKLGKKNEIVEVSPGYAQNFLFKKKLAVEASDTKIHEVEQQKGARKAQQARELEAAKEMAKELEGKKFTIKKKSGDNGKLYGQLTSMDVADALKAENFDVDKRDITIKHILKNVGSTEAECKLHTEVSCTITVFVEAL